MATHFKGPIVLTGTGTSTNAGNESIAGTLAVATSVAVGGGTAITKVLRGTVSVNPADLATLTAVDESITITGAAVGDTVIMNPPTAGLTAGMLICGAWVSATNTVKVRLYNTTGGSINEAAANWTYTLIRS